MFPLLVQDIGFCSRSCGRDFSCIILFVGIKGLFLQRILIRVGCGNVDGRLTFDQLGAEYRIERLGNFLHAF